MYPLRVESKKTVSGQGIIMYNCEWGEGVWGKSNLPQKSPKVFLNKVWTPPNQKFLDPPLFRVVFDIYKCKLLFSKHAIAVSKENSILGFLDFFKLMFHYALKTNDCNKVRISVYIRKQL